MSTQSTTNKASYTRHGAEYKQEYLRLAAQLDVAKAASKFNTKADSEYLCRLGISGAHH